MQAETRNRINLYLNVLIVVLAFSVPLYRKWVSIAAPLVMLLWFVEGRLPEKLAALKRHWLSLAVGGFIAFNLFSLLWTSDPVAGLRYVFKYYYLLLIPILATSLRSRFRDRAETAFLTGAALSVAVSFAIFAGLVRFRDAFPGNPSATMSHLDYSMVLAVAASIVLCRILEGTHSPRRIVVQISLLVFLVGGLLINIGRSGQLAFFLTAPVMVWVILGARMPRLTMSVLAGSVVVLALSYAVIQPFHKRVDSGIGEIRTAITTGRYDSNQGKRIAGFLVAAEMVKERPLLGTGAGDNMSRFQEVLDDRLPDLKPYIGWFPHLHNQYLQSITETGIVGLSLLLFILIALVAGPYVEPHDRHLAISLAIVYLVGFLGDPYFRKQLPLVLFAIIGGLVSARGRSLAWDGPEE